MESKSLSEIREVAEAAGINLEKLASLSNMDDEVLTKTFTEETITKITIALGVEFEDLFEFSIH